MSGFTSRLRHRLVLQPTADDGSAATGNGSGGSSGTTGGATAAKSYAYGTGAGRIR